MKINTWKRAALAVVAPALAIGVAVPSVAAAAPATKSTITDASGDAYDDDDDVTNAPYADIVSASGVRTGSNLVLTYRTVGLLSPESDPQWNSEFAWAYFLLDTNGDQAADYEVEYALDDDGDLYADVYRANTDTLVYEGDASYNNGAVVEFPLSAIGNASSIGYRVEVEYVLDNVELPDPLCAYDEAPEAGFARV